MTPNEATEMFQGIASRLVGILGACLVFGVLSFAAVEMLTTRPQVSVIATMNPGVKSETYVARHDSESFIRIATDGKKTITRIDSLRLTWLVTAGLGGIGLFFFRWPIAGLVIPKSTSESGPRE
jgi:hypothetical protein